ncbi:MAG: patatin-like phospholipase family protein [Candidatus Schekmanbacteria bacterium]|nr:patatin-like phospholipase family protein [Candidatus Schekmanbacteria bacterium]
MAYHFRNLVFEGGGVKGIAYVGAMKVLESKGILPDIVRVGGASAGAINALLAGLNYTPTEVKQILGDLDFKNFMDDDFGVVRDTDRLISEFGWYKGDFFRNWAARLIRDKTGDSESTFDKVASLKESRRFKDIYFMGANLSTGFSEVFSAEHTPKKRVADALRISMSIPLFFKAVRSDRGDVYVDGGLLDNYPVKLFDRQKYIDQFSLNTDYYDEHNKQLKAQGRQISPYVYNKETLGFRLDTAKEIAIFRNQAEPEHKKIKDFFDYAWGLVDTIMESQQSQHLHGDDWQRSVYIDSLGVKTTDFNLSDKKKAELEDSGRKGAEIYFKWYDDPDSTPVNRP